MSDAASGQAPAAEGKLARRPDAIEERRRIVAEMHAARTSTTAMAAVTGVTSVTVRDDLAKLGLRPWPRLTDEEREARVQRAAALKAMGAGNREIAAELGCSIADVPGYLDARRASRRFRRRSHGRTRRRQATTLRAGRNA